VADGGSADGASVSVLGGQVRQHAGGSQAAAFGQRVVHTLVKVAKVGINKVARRKGLIKAAAIVQGRRKQAVVAHQPGDEPPFGDPFLLQFRP